MPGLHLLFLLVLSAATLHCCSVAALRHCCTAALLRCYSTAAALSHCYSTAALLHCCNAAVAAAPPFLDINRHPTPTAALKKEPSHHANRHITRTRSPYNRRASPPRQPPPYAHTKLFEKSLATSPTATLRAHKAIAGLGGRAVRVDPLGARLQRAAVDAVVGAGEAGAPGAAHTAPRRG